MTKAKRYLGLVTLILAAAIATPVFAQRNWEGRGEGRGDRGGRWGERGDRGERRESNRRDEGREAEKPAASASTSPPSAVTPSATSFGTTSDAEKIRKSATETIKTHDKSGDGILAGDELAALGMSKAADANGDGKITHDELVAFRTPKTAPATTTAVKPTTTTASSETDPAKPGERKLVNDTRKSYRFKSTKDRLPSWRFADRDKNGDGQVSMSEYSRSWSDRTASEFQRYDTDGDGMITSKEVR